MPLLDSLCRSKVGLINLSSVNHVSEVIQRGVLIPETFESIIPSADHEVDTVNINSHIDTSVDTA